MFKALFRSISLVLQLLFLSFNLLANVDRDTLVARPLEMEKIKSKIAALEARLIQSKSPYTILNTYVELGEFYRSINTKEVAYKYFNIAYSQAQQIGDKEKELKIVYTLCRMYLSERNKTKNDFWIKKFEDGVLEAEGSNSQKHRTHLYLIYAIKFLLDGKFNECENYLSKCEDRIEEFEKHYDQWTVLNIRAHLSYSLHGSFDSAQYYYEKAMNFSDTTDNSLFNSTYNIGLRYAQSGRPEEALMWYDEAEKTPVHIYKIRTYRRLYKKKAEVLKELGREREAFEYLAAADELDKAADEVNQLIGMHEINTRYAVAEKDEKIALLEKWRRNYDQNKWWVLASMLLIFGLSAYSYLRWKKSDHEKAAIAQAKTKLEVEHQQTKEEITKIKQLVIKDHIVLKNKTKVLLEELLYIKAEDHYLLLQTLSEKEFVRGKLRAIAEELPPNFIRCHRSYIVNQNYIVQYRSNDVLLTNDDTVPVSRSHKKNMPGYA